MAKTHFKQMINPDYLGAYSLDNGKGGYDDAVFTIANLRQENIVGSDGKKEECTIMRFAERGVKPMIVNTTNMKMMAKIYKTPYIEDWAGKKVQIGAEAVRAFGEMVDALRIRPFVPRDKPPVQIDCESCGETVTATAKMTAAQVAAYAKSKFGQALCVKCATAANEQKKEEATPNEPEKEGANEQPADSNQQ